MRGQGIPTGYAYRVKRATTMERCCMGAVSQIIDLDNSSKPLPYKRRCSEIVGERLAAPAVGHWIMNNVG